jgi:hypothetical protein
VKKHATTNLKLLCGRNKFNPTQLTFQNTLSQAIDNALLSLKCINEQAFYQHIEKNYGLTQKQIPDKIELLPVRSLKSLDLPQPN